ncbi:MAG: hypothetical protein KY450_02605 [Actinobacteria bacterium]|nr:hypothetical protein [Actinomycetota bacterium]
MAQRFERSVTTATASIDRNGWTGGAGDEAHSTWAESTQGDETATVLRQDPPCPEPGPSVRQLLGTGIAALAAVALSACGGGAGGDTAQFCDEAADRIGAFRAAGGEVSPTIIGTLRELSLHAPDVLTDDFATVTEASGDQEMDRALDDIERFLVEECGLEVRT